MFRTRRELTVFEKYLFLYHGADVEPLAHHQKRESIADCIQPVRLCHAVALRVRKVHNVALGRGHGNGHAIYKEGHLEARLGCGWAAECQALIV